MKKILSFGLFEAIQLSDRDVFKKDIKYVGGLRFSNREEALKSVKKLQEMLTTGKIQLEDAIITAQVMSRRAEIHKFSKSSIKEGGGVWKEYLNHLKSKEGSN